jgi:hypothetical protein
MGNEQLFGFHRLTRRPIEWNDESVERLGPDERQIIAGMWKNRAQAELRVGARLASLSTELLQLGADSQVLALATQAPSDEIRHAEICRRVASRYSGADVPWPALDANATPERHGMSAELGCAIEVLGICCISETIASAYLQTSLSIAGAKIARSALRELLSDEIEHARIGWAHLASRQVTAPTRRALGDALVHLLDAALRVWTMQNECPRAAGFPDHGWLPTEQVRSIARKAIEELVLPGLAEVGIDARSAARWLTDVS